MANNGKSKEAAITTPQKDKNNHANKKEEEESIKQFLLGVVVSLVVVAALIVIIAALTPQLCNAPKDSSASICLAQPPPILEGKKKRNPWKFWKKKKEKKQPVPAVVVPVVTEEHDDSTLLCGAAYEIHGWIFGRQSSSSSSTTTTSSSSCPATPGDGQGESPPSTTDTPTLDLSEYPSLSTPYDWKLNKSQLQLVTKLAQKTRDYVGNHMDNPSGSNFETRVQAVSWGGDKSTRWWRPAQGSGLDGMDGGRLLAAYLRIMKYPNDLQSNFPFKLCSQTCDSEVALAHTLEWREKYKPWLLTPSAIKENADGFIYHHGYSPSAEGDDSGHSIVWYRLGQHKTLDPEAYFRALLNTLDRAIGDNLKRSNNKIGKYNCVLDGSGFQLNRMPSLKDVKHGLNMMQDHYPDRLGMIMIVNMSRVGEFLLKLIVPLISKEVREKIKLVPHNPQQRMEMLEALVGKEFIPDYIGGTSTYFPDQATYYPKNFHFASEAEGREYMTTMPYHGYD